MKLLDQVRDVMRKKRYSIQTEHPYITLISRYILFHNKSHPKDMGEREISQFLSHLAVDRRVASSTQNQAINALVFLYKHVLPTGFMKARYYGFMSPGSSVALEIVSSLIELVYGVELELPEVAQHDEVCLRCPSCGRQLEVRCLIHPLIARSVEYG
jgi:hypothetical protein